MRTCHILDVISYHRRRPLRIICTVTLVIALGTLAQAADAFVLKPLKPSGIYELGEKVGWTVSAAPGTSATGEFNYTLKKNAAEVILTGHLSASDGNATIETVLREPAMLLLDISSPGEKPTHQLAGAAVAPTQLQPVVPRPADFDSFWSEKIKWLHSIPEDAVLSPEDSGKPGVEYATIKLNNINKAHVYGQLAKPAREGKFPALLLLQWAGVYPLEKAWVADRAAEGWLVLNVEPHDLPGNLPAEIYPQLPAMLLNYFTIYNDDRDRNYFLQMYLGDYRAADYLASRPDWDGKTFLVMGTSMGGQQSLVMGGLHPKITHIIVHVPAGADSNGAAHGRTTGFPFWDASNPKVLQTGLYFDTVNFASRIKAPALVSMGFLDLVCPPVGIWTAYNQIPGAKEVVPLIDAAHNHQSTAEQQQAYTDRSNAWLAALVKGEPAPVK